MMEHLLICGEQRKSLIDNFVVVAERAHGSVPAEAGIAAVLYECRKFGAGGRHVLQVAPRNIAYTEETRASGIALLAHRLPDFAVGIGPVMVGRGPVQYVAVNVISREMVERTGHRLRDLNGKGGCGIVGQAMVLTGLIGKFRLQKKIVARDYASVIRGG